MNSSPMNNQALGRLLCDALQEIANCLTALELRVSALEHAPKAVSQLVATEYAVPRPEAKVLDCSTPHPYEAGAL